MDNKGFIPNLYFQKTKDAIELYKNWFGAKELFVFPNPQNPDNILHSHLTIGESELYMSDYDAEMTGKTIKDGEPSQRFMLNINLEKAEEVDALFNKGVELGGTPMMPPMTTDWAERFAMITDKMGISWAFNVSKPM